MERLLAQLEHNLGSVIMRALKDPDVIEIMLNPDGKLWLERLGIMEEAGNVEPSKARTILSLVADSLNTVANADHAIVEGELPIDGCRFEGLMPPVVKNPSFAIRKKAVRIFTLDEYVDAGIMPASIQDAIIDAIINRRNILVVGGTGSGKTTLVNAIIHALSVLAPDDRVAAIEDVAELQSSSKNTVIMRASVQNPIRDLVRATMRLRPDRILISEVRGGEALELLKAWNTGHPGGVATVHANSVEGGLLRLEELVAEASQSPRIPHLIGASINLCLYITRTGKGRKVAQAAHIHKFDPSTQTYAMEYIHHEEQYVAVA